MVEMKEKSVVILSGGPDSVTTMYWSKERGHDVNAITFNYGQKSKTPSPLITVKKVKSK
jgi:7-cyano-7-deazaguanine synthase